MLVGFGHFARTGKDTACELLAERHGFTHTSFARALKLVALDSRADLRAVVESLGWDAAKTEEPWTRDYLVDLGNAMRNHVATNVWVHACLDRIDNPYAGLTCISDVRYPNECEGIQREGGILIKITRPGVEPLDNIADQALIGWNEWDHVVDNDGTIEDLAKKLDAIVLPHL
jgi:hypothetical protein